MAAFGCFSSERVKCDRQFIRLFQISHENKQNWTSWKLFLHYRCLYILEVNPIFSDDIFCIIMTLKVWPPCWCLKRYTKMKIRCLILVHLITLEWRFKINWPRCVVFNSLLFHKHFGIKICFLMLLNLDNYAMIWHQFKALFGQGNLSSVREKSGNFRSNLSGNHE